MKGNDSLKRLTAIILICALLTGCANREESSGETSVSESTAIVASTSTATSSVGTSTVSTSTTVLIGSSTTTGSTAGSTAASTITSSTSKKTPETSTVTSITTAPAEPVVSKPSWKEGAIDAATLFVNTDGIYSRKYAKPGSETVKLYKLNERVTVVAKTDTYYYKLEDGTFIHMDYLSDTETEPPQSVEETVPTVSLSVDDLLNKAPLSPMLTNDRELDDLVADVLGQITNDGMTTSEKVRAIYDYMIENISYSVPKEWFNTKMNYHVPYDGFTVSRAHTLLVMKKGKCVDYSALFVVMTRRIGLESYNINGAVSAIAGGVTPHTWPTIRLDGRYYTFDPQVEQYNMWGSIPYIYYGRTEESGKGLYYNYTVEYFGNFVVDEGENPYKISY